MQSPFIIHENESRYNQPYNVLGMDVYLKIGGNDTNGQFSLFSSEYTKHQGPPLHRHNMDETFYITAGKFMFQIGDERYTATAGDILFVPHNCPHAFLTLSEQGKMLFMVNPTDTVEVLFERLSAYPIPPSINEVVRLHEELGLTIVGPPLNQE